MWRSILVVITLAFMLLFGWWLFAPPYIAHRPSELDWAKCFEPIYLPAPAQGEEVSLVWQGLGPMQSGLGQNVGKIGGPLDKTPVAIERQSEEVGLVVQLDPFNENEGPQEADQFSQAAQANTKFSLPTSWRITLTAKENWRIFLRGGQGGVLQRSDGARFLVEGPIRVGLVPGQTYTARLQRPVDVVPKIDQSGRWATLPPNAALQIVPSEGELVAVHWTGRIMVRQLVPTSPALTLTPQVQPGGEAAFYLTAKLAAPSLDFNRVIQDLRACLWLSQIQEQQNRKLISITRVDAAEAGLADLTLRLPSDQFDWWSNMRWGQRAIVAVASVDGTYAATGDFIYPPGLAALLTASLFTLAVPLALMYLAKKRNNPLGTPEKNIDAQRRDEKE